MATVLGFSGSPRLDANTDTLVHAVLAGAASAGAETRFFRVQDMNMRPCCACMWCRENRGCAMKDEFSPLWPELFAADAVVIGSPVYMWQMTAQTKTLVDRLYPSLNPDFSTRLAHKPKLRCASRRGTRTRRSSGPISSRRHRFCGSWASTCSRPSRRSGPGSPMRSDAWKPCWPRPANWAVPWFCRMPRTLRSPPPVEHPSAGPPPLSPRVEEALNSLRHKSPQATTLERLRIAHEAWQHHRDLPQPVQLGRILREILGRIETPVLPHDLLLGRIREDVPDEAGEKEFRDILGAMGARPPCMTDGGHETFDWERLLTRGLAGLRAEAEQGLAACPPEQRGFLAGMAAVAGAFQEYAARYGEEAGRAGLKDAAETVSALASRAPRTFREALQLVWLVGHVYATVCAVNATLTFGRLDQWLFPFYAADLAAGRLTRAEAGDLIEDFYCKNNLILGRGEHQMSGGGEFCTGWQRNLCYDAPQYVVLGGDRAAGRPDFSELTDLFLERIVPRFENPCVVMRHHPGMSARTWRLVCEKLRDNASMMVYNDLCVVPAMQRAGFPPAEAVEYTMHGCNWPDLPPSQADQGMFWCAMPSLLLEALDDLEDPAGMDDIHAAFLEAYRTRASHELAALAEAFRRRREQPATPLAVDDLFLDGPARSGRAKRHGGVRHPTFRATFSGFCTVVDSLAAIEQVVFVRRLVPWREFREALQADFAGREGLLAACRNAPKFGRDDERADRHAARLMAAMHAILDECQDLLAPVGGSLLRSVETDMQHLRMGRETGATPDGRRAGTPISENSSPSVGASTAGLTAMFRSLTRLPFDRCHSGALNVRLQPTVFAGEPGLERLSALLRTYFAGGGLQVQVSMADADTLRPPRRSPSSTATSWSASPATAPPSWT